MNTIVNVRQMGLRDRGVIRAVSARGELGRRIRDMGLVPGTEISVVGRAPLRDPVVLRLREYVLYPAFVYRAFKTLSKHSAAIFSDASYIERPSFSKYAAFSSFLTPGRFIFTFSHEPQCTLSDAGRRLQDHSSSSGWTSL